MISIREDGKSIQLSFCPVLLDLTWGEAVTPAAFDAAIVALSTFPSEAKAPMRLMAPGQGKMIDSQKHLICIQKWTKLRKDVSGHLGLHY